MGAGPERARRHVEHFLHVEAILQHDREAAVFGRAGRGRHALDHFALQHDVNVAQRASLRDELEEYRRGNVIRQIAHDAQVSAERTEVELERVAFVDDDAATGESLAQSRDDVAVDLDGVQRAHDAGERPRECAEAGTDFHHEVVRLRRDRGDDGGDDAFVDQKILAEALARPMRHRYQMAMSRQVERTATLRYQAVETADAARCARPRAPPQARSP